MHFFVDDMVLQMCVVPVLKNWIRIFIGAFSTLKEQKENGIFKLKFDSQGDPAIASTGGDWTNPGLVKTQFPGIIDSNNRLNKETFFRFIYYSPPKRKKDVFIS